LLLLLHAHDFVHHLQLVVPLVDELELAFQLIVGFDLRLNGRVAMA
jgi:hypothetical protein